MSETGGAQERTVVRLPLALKLGAGAAAVALVPLAALGVAVYDVNRTALQDASVALHTAVAEDLARTVSSQVSVSVDGLHAIAGALAREDLEADARVDIALALVSGAAPLEAVAIYDAQGLRVDTIESKAAVVAPPASLAPELLSRAREVGFAAHRYEPAGGSKDSSWLLVVTTFVMPGRGDAALGALVSLGPLQRRVRRAIEAFGGRLDTAAVYDGAGANLAYAGLVSPGAEGEPLAAMNDVDLSILAYPVTRSGPIVGDLETPLFGSVIARPRSGWAVAVQTRASVVFAPLLQTRSAVGGALAFAALLAIAAALVLSRQLVRPIRQLVGMTQALAARRFEERVSVRTRDELVLLGDALNGAAAELKVGEERLLEEAAIRQDLGRYLDPEVLERVVRREQDMGLGGRRQVVTVLFADVVGFTPLTEKLAPEEVVSFLNELFTILSEIVFRHGGVVDKFIGDSIMAIFGAPEPVEDHAERALSAAEEMLRWLEVGNAKWRAAHGVEVSLAIGVNGGEAVVGNIGSERRMEYTVIGETVNLAARLEASARPQQVLVGPATAAACGDSWPLQSLGPQQFAGLATPIEVYALRMD